MYSEAPKQITHSEEYLAIKAMITTVEQEI